MKPVNRIAFLSHPFHRGGVTRWMIEAAEECTNRGLETYFVTVDPIQFISGGRPTMKSLLENKNIKLTAHKKGKPFELGTIVHRQLTYARDLSRNVPVGTPVILSDDESIWGAGKLLSAQYPIIGVLHSDDDVYFDLYHRYYSYLSATVAVSNRVKLRVKDHAEIKVIPCGIRLPNVKTSQRQVNKLTLLWAGRIEERQKRVSDIAKIGRALAEKRIDFKWIIAGHGDESELKQLINQYGVDDNFEFTGWVDQKAVYSLMQKADMLVLTSNFEGMPLIVMEALAMGMGVVSSRVSGLEDLENDELAETVLRLYDIGDVVTAADKILDLIDKDQYERSVNAQKLASKYYSIEKCMDSYLNVIQNIPYSRITPRSNLHFVPVVTQTIASWGLFLLRILKFRLKQRL